MSRRLRSALVVASVTAVVVVVGQVLVPGRRPASTKKPATVATAPAPRMPAAPSDAAVAVSGATTVVAGVPMGYRHDKGGAKAAATAFAEAYGTLVTLDDAGAQAAKRTMAASASAERLVGDMEGRLAALRRVWPVGTITYRVAPLAVRVAMDGADDADADVWYVGVVAGRGIPTYEEWVTETYRLVWERDDWRIAADSESPGPRPDPGRQSPATPAEMDSRLAGFEALP